MSNYRLYRLNVHLQIIDVEDFDGPDDEAAIAEAIRIDHAFVIEIWTAKRFVFRVSPIHR